MHSNLSTRFSSKMMTLFFFCEIWRGGGGLYEKFVGKFYFISADPAQRIHLYERNCPLPPPPINIVLLLLFASI
jgi:hypothetical protein